MKKIQAIIFFLFLISSIPPANAALLNSDKSTSFYDNIWQAGRATDQAGNYVDSSVEEMVGVIIRLSMTFLGTIFIVIMIVAGINWIRAGGNEEIIKKSQTTITNLLIGLILVIAAYALSYGISNILLKTLK